jgi:hypothetical protein
MICAYKPPLRPLSRGSGYLSYASLRTPRTGLTRCVPWMPSLTNSSESFGASSKPFSGDSYGKSAEAILA